MLLDLLNRLYSRFPLIDGGAVNGGGAVDEDDNDDPNAADDDDVTLADRIDPEDELEDDPEDKEDDKTKVIPEKPAVVTQEELDRIIARVIAKERNRTDKLLAEKNQKEEAEREQAKQEELKQSQVEKKAKRLVDRFGYDEEVAREIAEEEVEKDLRIARLEKDLQDSKKVSQVTAQTTVYSQQKVDIVGKNPLAAKFVKEIDAFSQNGAVLDFETAMNFILGQKLASGELLNDIKVTAEQKTLRDVQSRKNKGVEKDGQGGDNSKIVTLTPQERKLARNFGLSEKEWASEKSKQNKRKR